MREYSQGMELALGYDLLTEKIRAKSVEGVTTESATPFDSRFFCREVTSQSQLADCLGVSAAISAKANILNVGTSNSNLIANFASQVSNTRYYSYFLIQFSVRNSEVSIQDPKLIDSAIQLLESGKSEDFRRRFGDEFITGSVKGGRFIAFIKVKNDTEEERIKLSNQFNNNLSGNNINVNASLDINAKSSMSNFFKSVSSIAEVEVYQQAISPYSQPRNIQEVFSCLDAFQKQMEEGKFVNYQVRLIDYHTLELPSNAQLIDINRQQQYIENTLQYRSEYLTQLNDIKYVLENNNKFEKFNISNLTDIEKRIRQKVQQIDKTIQECVNSPYSFTEVNFQEDIIEFKLPERIIKKAIPFSFRPTTNTRNLIPDLIDSLLGTAPKQVPTLTREWIYSHSMKLRFKNINIKRVMILLNKHSQQKDLYHIVILCLDQKNDPVTDDTGKSITREYLTESLDNELTEIFASKDRYFIEFE